MELREFKELKGVKGRKIYAKSSTFATVMGILYIVPTPVGNMEDMTLRAIRILKEADLVLAEDTRTSGILLKHFGIQQHLLSHHKFNEHGTSATIVERLQAGQTVALISDVLRCGDHLSQGGLFGNYLGVFRSIYR